jgi:solute carrier family 39 (zinc transporter), member 1/2/3
MLLWIVERVLLGNHSHSVHGDHDSEPDEETPIPPNKSAHASEETPFDKPVCSDDEMPRADIQHLSHVKPFLAAMVFLVALSLHSIFEGLGLGAENDAKGVYTTIVAVASHKALEAFALGLAIHRAKFALWKSIILLVMYACATPLGT